MGDLEDLHTAITSWIGKRKATLEAMEKLAEDIKSEGEKFNGVKLCGALAGAISGAFEVMGDQEAAQLANTAGTSFSIISDAAEVAKNDTLSSLLQEAMGTIDQEMVEYQMVIGNLAILYATITGKSNYLLVSPEVAQATHKIAMVIREKKAIAAKAAASAAIQATAKMGLAKISARTGGHIAKKTVGQVLPIVSMALAAWDTYEGYKAGREIEDGSGEEILLREKIGELRKEAIVIVDEIFNVFADAENWMMPPIHNPFENTDQ